MTRPFCVRTRPAVAAAARRESSVAAESPRKTWQCVPSHRSAPSSRWRSPRARAYERAATACASSAAAGARPISARHHGRHVCLEIDLFDGARLQAKDLSRARRGRCRGPKRRAKGEKRSEQEPPGHVRRDCRGRPRGGQPRPGPGCASPASPRSVATAWGSTEATASRHSTAPRGEPGRFTMSVRPHTAATCRDRIAVGHGGAGRFPHDFREAGHLVIEDVARRLRRDVARREARAARREHEIGGARVREALEVPGDVLALVGQDRLLHDDRAGEQALHHLGHGGPALVGALAVVRPVRDRQDGDAHGAISRRSRSCCGHAGAASTCSCRRTWGGALP